MSILNTEKPVKRQNIRLSIDTNIYQQVQSYCKWANLDRPATFFEKAAEFVFAKDEKWKNRNKSSSAKPTIAAKKATTKTTTTGLANAATHANKTKSSKTKKEV